MSGSSKRGLPAGGESSTPKRSLRSSVGSRPPASQTPGELLPFDIPDDINAIRPEDVLGCSRAFSPEFYAQDLFHIFATPVTAGRSLQIEMHKVWFKCRKPHVDELWASRYPEPSTYQKTYAPTCLRIVLTIEKMLEMATEEALIRRLQFLHLDYIMLMCLLHESMEKPDLHFPAHQEQFYNLVDILGDKDQMAPPAEVPDRRVTGTAIAGPVVSPAKRILFEGLRVDADRVTPMHKISGYDEAKRIIKASTFVSTSLPHFAAHGIGSKGILLCGPPGTGKTLLAKSVAASECAVFYVSSSDLIVKWQGESEQNVAAMFAIAAENAPAIIIIDEVESLCQNRQSSTASDGTTNLPWQLDLAFARRFPRRVFVGLPSKYVRLDMVKQRLQPFHHNLNSQQMDRFAEECDGFPGNAVVGTIDTAIEDLAAKIESAEYFQKVKLHGQEFWCPCGPEDDGIKRSFKSFKEEGTVSSVTTQLLTIELLRAAAKGFKAQVSKSMEDAQKVANWVKDQFYSEPSSA